MSKLNAYAFTAALLFSALASAEEVRLGCLTDRVWVQSGIPQAMMVRFDEQLNRATLFASELGGLLSGDRVIIETDMIRFRFRTPAGALGEATIMRDAGTLMLKVSGGPDFEVLATCRKEVRRF
jgi:hypothetical protein